MAKLLAFFLLFLALSSLCFVNIRAEEEDLDTEEDVEVFEEDESDPSTQPPPSATTDEDDGDDDEESEYEDEESKEAELAPSPDVEAVSIFPDFPDKRIIVGEKVTLLVGLTNTGDKVFNLSALAVHLHSPFDYSYYIQNYTVKELSVLLQPKSQVSLEYTFSPDKSLEPLEFWLSAYVMYNDTESNLYRTTFINGTIELVERPSSFDVRGLFTYVLLLGGFGLFCYFIFNHFNLGKFLPKGVVGKKKRAASVEQGTRSASADASWDSDVYKPAKTTKTVRRR